jgi:cleavage and polyadenylation specificity factor subunit 3
LQQKLRNVLFFQLDCGIHPGLSGMDALPFVDLVEADEIDLLLISQ